MEEKPPFKFLATKRADAYFHFFADCQRKTTGSRITLYPKERINSDELLSTIKKYVRYVEIPIQFKYAGKTIEVDQQSFSLSVPDELRSYIRPSSHHLLSRLDIIQSSSESETHSAVLGLIVQNSDGYIDTIYLGTDKRMSGMSSNVEISQQGIYINTPYYFRGNFLKRTIGKINLKKKNSLLLNRTGVMDDRTLVEIINDLEIDILEQIFHQWKRMSVELQYKLCCRLIDQQIDTDSYRFIPEKLLQFVQDHFILRCYQGDQFRYVRLEDLFVMHEYALISDKTHYNRKDIRIEELYKKLKITLVYCSNNNNEDDFYSNIFQTLAYRIRISHIKDNYFYIITPKKNTPTMSLQSITYTPIFPFNSEEKLVTELDYFPREVLNENHQIIRFLLVNSRKIEKNERLKDHLQRFFELVRSIYDFDVKIEFVLDQCNKYLTYINAIFGTDFRISLADFG